MDQSIMWNGAQRVQNSVLCMAVSLMSHLVSGTKECWGGDDIGCSDHIIGKVILVEKRLN